MLTSYKLSVGYTNKIEENCSKLWGKSSFLYE